MQEWIQILLKSIGLFFVVFIAVRAMGKRSITRITPFQFVSYIVIAILAVLISTNMIQNLAMGLITLGIWVLFSTSLDYLAMKSKWAHDLIIGKETIVVKNGMIMEENLKQLRLTGEELLRDIRSKSIFNLADVEFAIMEATGEMNVMLKAARKPLSPHDLGQQVAPHAAPQTVVLDGNIINEALGSIGLNQDWLKSQLETAGVSLDNVFIGQVDSSGDLYLDLFDDAIQVPYPRVKEMLYANLQKAQADLMGYGMETQSSEAKKMYNADADRLKDILNKLEPFLLH